MTVSFHRLNLQGCKYKNVQYEFELLNTSMRGRGKKKKKKKKSNFQMLEFFCFVFFLSSSNLHLIQIQKAVTKYAAQRDFLKAFAEANQTLSLGFLFSHRPPFGALTCVRPRC